MANMMPIGNKFFKNSSVEKDMKQVEIDKSNKIIFIHLNFSPIILIKENEKNEGKNHRNTNPTAFRKVYGLPIMYPFTISKNDLC